jgi:hypothetical protein
LIDEGDEARAQARIAEAVLGHGPVLDDPRLALYRRLVRNNLTGVTAKMLERTKARLNALGGLFDASFDAFLADVGPRTHYLRDVPHELLAWAERDWPARAGVPAWALDLARHELVEFAVSAAPSTPSDVTPADIALDRPLLFAEPLRLVRYAYAVHELSEDPDDRAEPAARETRLLVYRDEEHAARFLELSPFAAALLARLVEGAALGEAVKAACDALGVPPSEGQMAQVSELLASLAERGVVLGARAVSGT